jgi:hypothetical protein
MITNQSVYPTTSRMSSMTMSWASFSAAISAMRSASGFVSCVRA